MRKRRVEPDSPQSSRGEGPRLGDGIPQAVQFQRALPLRRAGPHRPQAGEGGGDILGQGHMPQGAHPAAEGGGDEQPVGLRLGGGRGDGPFQQCGRDW